MIHHCKVKIFLVNRKPYSTKVKKSGLHLYTKGSFFSLILHPLLASSFLLICGSQYMTAIFKRGEISGNINTLYLRDGHCKASWNSTHIVVKTPLHGCGTEVVETDQYIIYTNVISHLGASENYNGDDVITRSYLNAKMICTYPRKRRVGVLSFEPAKENIFVSSSKS